ncbi:hypothetical protein [Vibrio sp. VB16]|uniref:hypothetical protein n=1 Tax=Vibrio sp. VB16 TaxID=2785746 RepID=UPI00189D4825|nr:hypothetical protein [Vibrio sp. VB16]UGA53563.1 hypothetical protein IUZ65_009635 [Vibrio sp. VB16]
MFLYSVAALAKSSVGIGLSCISKGTYKSFLYVAPAHLDYGELSESASARRNLWNGKTNLAQFTT